MDPEATLVAIVAGVLILAIVAVPAAIAVGLFVLGKRHLEGRRTRYDRLFEGIGRANAMRSHHAAGTPDPDDLAVPRPERPGT